MGFWQTGYLEFHEEVGLGTDEYEPPKRQYPCSMCEEVFDTAEALQQHRFESHPLHPPLLILRGKECRSHRIQITSKLKVDEVRAEQCDRVVVNRQEVPIQAFARELAVRTSDTCRVALSNADTTTEYTLEFRIASAQDLVGVEREFERIASGRRLDMRTVESFIDATKEFATADTYSDGVCTYLHGVLAKEQAAGCPLPYEKYRAKYERAVDELNSYDRPLARAIVSAIEFHHNHFPEAATSGGNSRIGRAAWKYQRWLGPRAGEPTGTPKPPQTTNALEQSVTDRETEQIATWAIQPAWILTREAKEMEAFVKRDVAEFDRVKVRILLSEMYAAIGDAPRAIDHAKDLSHIHGFEEWANKRIQACSRRA